MTCDLDSLMDTDWGREICRIWNPSKIVEYRYKSYYVGNTDYGVSLK